MGLAQERPNVLLILADDMGFSDLGCYGGEIQTPNLDRLAGDGLRFTQAYNTSKCFPSRACLLTGAYAQQVGMDKGPGRITGAVTLGEVMRSAGYRTLMVGKHHGTENPFDRGFDRYFGLRDGACNYFNPGKQRAGEPKPAQKRAKRAWCVDNETFTPYAPEAGFYTTDAFTDHALEYLEEYREEPNPFFLYVSYNAPHDPLQAWPKDIERYRGRYDAGWSVVRAARHARQLELGLFDEETPLSDAEFGEWSELDDGARREEARRMEVYAAMIDCLDQNVGRLLTKLEELGELDNTLILFASDNGSSAEVVRIGEGEIGSITRWASLQSRWANVSNTPFRKYKNHSFEGGICTPLIAHWPSGIKNAGGFVRTPLHLIDVMPTLVELSGANYPSEHGGNSVVPMQGVSLAPLFQGEGIERSNLLFWSWSKGAAVRDGAWKLVHHGGPWELYDTSVDRTETENLAGSQPGVVERLSAAWTSWQVSVSPPPGDEDR
jgi:arylsulfatase